eukprot:2291186-Amphidinium_carterae.1
MGDVPTTCYAEGSASCATSYSDAGTCSSGSGQLERWDKPTPSATELHKHCCHDTLTLYSPSKNDYITVWAVMFDRTDETQAKRLTTY